MWVQATSFGKRSNRAMWRSGRAKPFQISLSALLSIKSMLSSYTFFAQKPRQKLFIRLLPGFYVFTQLFVPQASQSSYDRRAELDVRLAIPSAQSACGMEDFMPVSGAGS